VIWAHKVHTWARATIFTHLVLCLQYHRALVADMMRAYVQLSRIVLLSLFHLLLRWAADRSWQSRESSLVLILGITIAINTFNHQCINLFDKY